MIRISVLSLFYSAHWIYTKLLHGMNMIKYVKIKCCVSSIELLKCQTIWQYRHYFCATVKAYQTVNRSFCMDGLFLPPKFIPPHDGQNKPLLPAPQLCSCHSNPLTNNNPCICTLKPWEADEMCPPPNPFPKTPNSTHPVSPSLMSRYEIILRLRNGF